MQPGNKKRIINKRGKNNKRKFIRRRKEDINDKSINKNIKLSKNINLDYKSIFKCNPDEFIRKRTFKYDKKNIFNNRKDIFSGKLKINNICKNDIGKNFIGNNFIGKNDICK